jgi:prolyl oligopeptidase
MQRTILAALALVVAGCLSPVETPKHSKGAAMRYPDARRSDQVDDYHGTKVPDPYRWLEDPDSPETRKWIEAENKLTFDFLEKVPQRANIRDRIEKLWNYERFGLPTKRGKRYVYSRNDGLQNQSVLYTVASLDDEPRLLLDPNKLSKEGTVALTGYTLSEDGSMLAYGLAEAGSDWQKWQIRDVETGKDLDDVVRWVKFSGASWSHSGDGFYYSRYDEPAEGVKFTGTNYFQKLYFHKLGTPQSDDKLVYERTDEKEWGFHGGVTDDGRYLIISVTRGTDPKNQVFYLDLEDPQAKVVELITGFDADYTFVGNEGAKFWFRTDLDAPRYRMVAVDLAQPERAHWKATIPESKDMLDEVSQVGGRFFASYLHDAHSRVEMFDLAGKSLGEVTLPGLGTAFGFGGRDDDTETFFGFTSFTSPSVIYRLDVASQERTVFRSPKVDFNADNYETKQVFVTSRDGTKVPMFIVHRKGIELNGKNPTYLYAYGGFNISLTPSFDVRRIAWLELGGIYAMPNLRGGGEYGRQWHEGGMKANKQNVFDDFIASAEYLIKERYTSTPKLAIAGGSNGGLLVGACMTQRPDLFGACLPAVGVHDMLRFHKFTIGWAWASEYGSSDNAGEFAVLKKYSPLHNIKPGIKYPPTLIETADHDDRVVPAHSFKFAAELQAAQAGDAPILIRIETSAGHGAGTPTSKMIDETTDKYAFLVRVLGM